MTRFALEQTLLQFQIEEQAILAKIAALENEGDSAAGLIMNLSEETYVYRAELARLRAIDPVPLAEYRETYRALQESRSRLWEECSGPKIQEKTAALKDAQARLQAVHQSIEAINAQLAKFGIIIEFP